jgi:hypothetical protein
LTHARKSDVVSLREAAVELMAAEGHQQELRTTIEPQLIQLNCRWGKILLRIHVSNGVLDTNQQSAWAHKPILQVSHFRKYMGNFCNRNCIYTHQKAETLKYEPVADVSSDSICNLPCIFV